MATITKEQARALVRVFSRTDPKPASTDELRRWWLRFLAFRRTVVRAAYDSCIMVRWQGMWLGIERDGYTHS